MIVMREAAPNFVALDLRNGRRPLHLGDIQALSGRIAGVSRLRVDVERRMIHVLYDGSKTALQSILEGLRGLGYEARIPDCVKGCGGQPEERRKT